MWVIVIPVATAGGKVMENIAFSSFDRKVVTNFTTRPTDKGIVFHSIIKAPARIEAGIDVCSSESA